MARGKIPESTSKLMVVRLLSQMSQPERDAVMGLAKDRANLVASLRAKAKKAYKTRAKASKPAPVEKAEPKKRGRKAKASKSVVEPVLS